LAFLASGVEGLKVRITAKAADEAAAQEILDAQEAELLPLIGEFVFGRDEQNMEAVVIEKCTARGLTIAVAESLTGGYVSGRLCAVPGASAVFKGSMVSYDASVKHKLLGVPEGPTVSEPVAVAMAQGVREVMGADVGLATTGVAGPAELDGLPVGTVCLAVAAEDGAIATTVQMPGDRERIRQFSTIALLNMFRKTLL
jgi:nicotinamide-nucleotide amidase